MFQDCALQKVTFTTSINLLAGLGKLGIILHLHGLTIGCISWHHLHQAASWGQIFHRLWRRASQALCRAFTPHWRKPGGGSQLKGEGLKTKQEEISNHRMSISCSTPAEENPKQQGQKGKYPTYSLFNWCSLVNYG